MSVGTNFLKKPQLLVAAQVLALDQTLTLEYQGTTYTLKALHMLATGAAGASLALERGLLTDATQVNFSAASGAKFLLFPLPLPTRIDSCLQQLLRKLQWVEVMERGVPAHCKAASKITCSVPCGACVRPGSTGNLCASARTSRGRVVPGKLWHHPGPSASRPLKDD